MSFLGSACPLSGTDGVGETKDQRNKDLLETRQDESRESELCTSTRMNYGDGNETCCLSKSLLLLL